MFTGRFALSPSRALGDFWESKEAFDAFVGDRLGPRLHSLGDRGFPNPPDVKVFEVHNLQVV